MKISKLVELRKLIGHIFSDLSSQELPKVITYSRGIEFPKYKITIEEIEEDYFIDSKGQKWAKVKDADK